MLQLLTGRAENAVDDPSQTRLVQLKEVGCSPPGPQTLPSRSCREAAFRKRGTIGASGASDRFGNGRRAGRDDVEDRNGGAERACSLYDVLLQPVRAPRRMRRDDDLIGRMCRERIAKRNDRVRVADLAASVEAFRQ